MKGILSLGGQVRKRFGFVHVVWVGLITASFVMLSQVTIYAQGGTVEDELWRRGYSAFNQDPRNCVDAFGYLEAYVWRYPSRFTKDKLHQSEVLEAINHCRAVLSDAVEIAETAAAGSRTDLSVPVLHWDPSARTYTNPTIYRIGQNVEYRLDYCRVPAGECGQPAADAYCMLPAIGFARASSFVIDQNVDQRGIRTMVFATNDICTGNAGSCDSFKEITCTNY